MMVGHQPKLSGDDWSIASTVFSCDGHGDAYPWEMNVLNAIADSVHCD